VPQRVTVTTSDDDDDNGKEVDDSVMEHVAATKHNSKCLVRQPVGHFEKLLEATCPNHAYTVRHKLKECSMIKNYMTTGVLAKGMKPKSDPGGKATARQLGLEAACALLQVGAHALPPAACILDFLMASPLPGQIFSSCSWITVPDQRCS
jgi:hypothetical protein